MYIINSKMFRILKSPCINAHVHVEYFIHMYMYEHKYWGILQNFVKLHVVACVNRKVLIILKQFFFVTCTCTSPKQTKEWLKLWDSVRHLAAFFIRAYNFYPADMCLPFWSTCFPRCNAQSTVSYMKGLHTYMYHSVKFCIPRVQPKSLSFE